MGCSAVMYATIGRCIAEMVTQYNCVCPCALSLLFNSGNAQYNLTVFCDTHDGKLVQDGIDPTRKNRFGHQFKMSGTSKDVSKHLTFWNVNRAELRDHIGVMSGDERMSQSVQSTLV